MMDLVYIGIVVAALLIALVVLLSLRAKEKRIREEKRFLKEMPIHFVGLPREKDIEADSIVRKVRDNIALNWMSAAPSGPEAFYKVTNDLVNDIAKVYYPKAKEPVKQVNVNALMAFYKRVSARINLLLQVPPFTLIGKVDLRMMVALKEGTDKVMNHPITQTIMGNPLTGIIKRIPFMKMRKAVKIAKKIKTPMGMIIEAGKEITIEGAKRLFLSELIGIIAEEAIQVFSGRMVKDENSKGDLLSLYLMAQILREQDEISAQEHQIFLEKLVNFKHLDDEFKLFLLAYAIKREKMLGNTLENLINQVRVSENIKKDSLAKEKLQKEERTWHRFAELEDFTPLRDLKRGRAFLESLEPLVEAEGTEIKRKKEIFLRAKADLGSDYIN
jgi:hypothetical protein